jgi:regulator of protease activity HflC (stomatin/prohibitin superfamily)
MSTLTTIVVVVAVLVLVGLALSVRIVQQYEKGVLFRLGRVIGVREPGLTLIIPVIEVLRRVSLRIVTMPIQSQGIITRDNVSIDVSAVAYYRVVDATKSVVAIENVAAAINQIAQTTLQGGRPAHPGPDPGRDRPDQRGHPRDPGRAGQLGPGFWPVRSGSVQYGLVE